MARKAYHTAFVAAVESDPVWGTKAGSDGTWSSSYHPLLVTKELEKSKHLVAASRIPEHRRGPGYFSHSDQQPTEYKHGHSKRSQNSSSRFG